ncbi:tropomyosin 1 alpha [Cyclospora cayetanensis]|uniref:Tropomyosin 1 alpha n=1 Tax=Cyclospora cayetanensis TaxID=88456 RepID=A0A1D3CY71_9EIME|nr:tropomyosin 1 alpha [Cyclospora cayetanensis]
MLARPLGHARQQKGLPTGLTREKALDEFYKRIINDASIAVQSDVQRFLGNLAKGALSGAVNSLASTLQIPGAGVLGAGIPGAGVLNGMPGGVMQDQAQPAADSAPEAQPVDLDAIPQWCSPHLPLKSKLEKLEFARAVACLGKMNSPEMRQARSAELAEMATIKGHTIAELQAEIAEAQEELTKAKSDRRRVQQELRQVASNAVEGGAADVLFLKRDTQLADEKITIYLDKLQRLEINLWLNGCAYYKHCIASLLQQHVPDVSGAHKVVVLF